MPWPLPITCTATVWVLNTHTFCTLPRYFFVKIQMASHKCSCSVSSEQRKTNDVPGSRITWELSKMAGSWGRWRGDRGPAGDGGGGLPRLGPCTHSCCCICRGRFFNIQYYSDRLCNRYKSQIEAREAVIFPAFIFSSPDLTTVRGPCLLHS